MRITETGLGLAVWSLVNVVRRSVNTTYVAGVALATAAAGYFPGDTRRVDGVALVTHVAGHFPGDTRQLDGAALTAHVAGQMPSDNLSWKGTALAAVDTAGYPKVTVKSGTGTGEISLSSGLVQTVTTNPGAIRSIQRRTMTITSGSSNTSTLSPTLTDTAKSEVRMLGFSLAQVTYADPSHDFPRIELTSTTTVTANVGSNVSATITISYEVTERY